MKETCDQCGAGFERLEARHVCDGLFYLFSSGKLSGVRDQIHDEETTYCAACYYECREGEEPEVWALSRRRRRYAAG